MTKQKSVLLLGSYGHTNLGDDVLMWNYLEYLKSLSYTNIYVNVNDPNLVPQPIRQKYPDLHMLETYKTSIATYIRIMREVDCVVYGGGTIYKELYASTGRSKYSVIQRLMIFNVLARLLGARIYHLHIGIGSLKTSLGRFITKHSLAPATYSLLRDHESYVFARDTLKLPDTKLYDTTDGLFLNQIWRKPWHKAPLPPAAKKTGTVIGINVLSDIPDWVDRKAYITTIRQFVKNRLEEGSYVVFVPFQHDHNPRNDRLFMHKIFDDILATYPNHHFIEQATIDTISSLVKQCDVFVGMRFHSLLLSTVNHVPFVGIAY
ncbi:MAG TPA: polysaccharide pyruvyl transferase family protein, partial [Magnetospirillaceae bacterium]|nr:polysaccharide pyruvyl transferase family protein [Magnetospirillaceae bacterium]